MSAITKFQENQGNHSLKNNYKLQNLFKQILLPLQIYFFSSWNVLFFKEEEAENGQNHVSQQSVHFRNFNDKSCSTRSLIEVAEWKNDVVE